eukprot:COSAG01_NODE_8157_length_2898_cov_1.780993_1_plen_213_part_00
MVKAEVDTDFVIVKNYLWARSGNNVVTCAAGWKTLAPYLRKDSTVNNGAGVACEVMKPELIGKLFMDLDDRLTTEAEMAEQQAEFRRWATEDLPGLVALSPQEAPKRIAISESPREEWKRRKDFKLCYMARFHRPADVQAYASKKGGYIERYFRNAEPSDIQSSDYAQLLNLILPPIKTQGSSIKTALTYCTNEETGISRGSACTSRGILTP